MTAAEPAASETTAVFSGRQAVAGRSGEASREPRRAAEFERLYAAHARPLLAFLVYRTGEQTLAEDLLADTFERVWRTRRRYDRGRGSEKTWLYTIALNCLRDHARRESARARAIGRAAGSRARHDDPPDDRLADHDFVRRGLARLSEDERVVVSLRYGADLTMPEIAKIVGQPLTTVEARVYRGLERLRAALGAPSA